MKRRGLALVAALAGTVGVWMAAPPPAIAAAGDCDVAGALPGTGTSLVNAGFESGDLTGWTVGEVADAVTVSGGDEFAEPWEGDHMAVLGAPRPSSEVSQPQGANEICQDLVVQPGEVLRFAYNVFTYDYTGFDEFAFRVTLVDPATGETLASTAQGGFGVGTELKTTGWRGLEVDLGGYEGSTVRVLFTAGGTSDQLYGFWAYIDSADSSLPAIVVPLADVETSGNASTTTDPSTGMTQVSMPTGSPDDVTFTVSLACEGEVTAATLLVQGKGSYPLTEGASGSYTATVPFAPGDAAGSYEVFVSYTCEGSTTSTQVATIWLYDPSGDVTNSVTGAPVQGATVTLYRVPGWVPSAVAEGEAIPDGECETMDNRGAGWDQPAPTNLGVAVPAASNTISPNINPQVTNAQGRYGWDVAVGCYYVTVTAPGYVAQTSPVVGVPPEVTDLDIALVPLAGGGGGGGGVRPGDGAGGTDPAPLRCDGEVTHDFDDVVGDTHEASIACMAQLGFLTGGEDGRFDPAGSLSRAQMVLILDRIVAALGLAPDEAPDAFDDDTGALHEEAANRLAALGIVTGLDDGTLGGSDPVTRGQLASMLVRFAAFAGDGLPAGPDAFGDDAGDVHEPAINTLAAAGILAGRDGQALPGDPVTRGQTATLVLGLLGVIDAEGPAA